jgi:SH3-like domain-containing protein
LAHKEKITAMFHRHWIFVLLIALLVPVGCKKKPKRAADAGAQAPEAAATTPAEAAPLSPNEGIIKWPRADFRDNPGGVVVFTLSKGARVEVLERREGWTRARSVESKREGWLASDGIEGGVPGGAPAAEPAKPPPAEPAPKQVQTRARSTNLRDAARGRIIARLPPGTVLTVIREEADWLEVKGAGKQGWVARQVVVPVQPAAATPAAQTSPSAPVRPPDPGAPGRIPGAATVRWKSVNLRDAREGKILTQIPKGTVLEILSTKPGWLEVKTSDGRSGWIVDRAVDRVDGSGREATREPPRPQPTVASPTPAGGSATVRWPKVNLRASPPKGAVLNTLVQGTRVEILKREGKWARVRAGGQEGWMVLAALALGAEPAASAAPTSPPSPPSALPQPTPAATPSTVTGPLKQVVWTTVNLREAPGEKVIDKLARGTRLRELETEEGWVKVQTLDGRRTGWVDRRSIGPAK